MKTKQKHLVDTARHSHGIPLLYLFIYIIITCIYFLGLSVLCSSDLLWMYLSDFLSDDSLCRCLLSLSRSTKLLRTTLYDHTCWKHVVDMLSHDPSECHTHTRACLRGASAVACNLLLPFSPCREASLKRVNGRLSGGKGVSIELSDQPRTKEYVKIRPFTSCGLCVCKDLLVSDSRLMLNQLHPKHLVQEIHVLFISLSIQCKSPSTIYTIYMRVVFCFVFWFLFCFVFWGFFCCCCCCFFVVLVFFCFFFCFWGGGLYRS